MKLIENDKEWEWNNIDEKLSAVIGWLDDLELVVNYLPGDCRRTVIQAGGAMGQWPFNLAKYFERVYTFEPQPENFRCLQENTKDLANVHATNAGLGKINGFCTVKLHNGERNNAGAFYTMLSDNGIPQLVLDDLDIEGSVDLIQLDVEGREFEVLQGAQNIIEQFSPIIMLEEKRLSQDGETGHIVGQAEQYLKNIGYKIINKTHNDIIFKRNLKND